uniref:DAP3 binding cell death enhancer 1 n=1 Tax=Crocodylus porosus TaxID=8502 RepID=A0A7M4FC36_CROPO
YVAGPGLLPHESPLSQASLHPYIASLQWGLRCSSGSLCHPHTLEGTPQAPVLPAPGRAGAPRSATHHRGLNLAPRLPSPTDCLAGAGGRKCACAYIQLSPQPKVYQKRLRDPPDIAVWCTYLLGVIRMFLWFQAALYYCHAARSGHLKAQYRYARCLLHYGSKAEKADLQKARTLLEQAAAAGLMEAQAYLGVLYMKGMFPAKQKALKYLWLAAKNGDSQSRYHVGVCYEEGLGVQKNLAEAVNNYQQSAAAGNWLAWERVQALEQQCKHPQNSAFSSELLCRSVGCGLVCSQSVAHLSPSVHLTAGTRAVPGLRDCLLFLLLPRSSV